MSTFIEFSWLGEEPSLKIALQSTFGLSGQLIKKYFSSKQLSQKVSNRMVFKIPIALVNHLKINPQYSGPKIEIISESDDFIVLHKPPGVHCHPHNYDDQNTLLNFLVTKKKWDALKINEDSYDRGLLYRLDFETSGVIVLAKEKRFFDSIRGHFDISMKRKFYWAIVEGDFNKEGRWVSYFKSTGQKGIKQRVFGEEVEDSILGILSVAKISENQGKSLLLVSLKTGLRHQIRAQLSNLGFPILGDELYGGKKSDRLFLHAFRYEFSSIAEDPNAELFHLFFDLNGALQMTHDMLGRF